MAAALGVSKSTVQRVWTQLRLKPHQLDRYRASNDPQFEEFVAFLEGLVSQTRWAKEIHVVLDNLSAHKTRM